MRKWVLDLTSLKQDMVETLDYWTGMVIYPYPMPHAKVYWDCRKVQEDHGILFWYEKVVFRDHYLYGEGKLPEIEGVVYWIPLGKEELTPFLSNDRLVIEVYETAEGMDGDIVVAVNGMPVARSNKNFLPFALQVFLLGGGKTLATQHHHPLTEPIIIQPTCPFSSVSQLLTRTGTTAC